MFCVVVVDLWPSATSAALCSLPFGAVMMLNISVVFTVDGSTNFLQYNFNRIIHLCLTFLSLVALHCRFMMWFGLYGPRSGSELH